MVTEGNTPVERARSSPSLPSPCNTNRRIRPRISEAQKKKIRLKRKCLASIAHDDEEDAALFVNSDADSKANTPCILNREKSPVILFQKRQEPSSSLPLLLLQRAQGLWSIRSNRQMAQWQGRMSLTGRSFRPYTRQQLDFASLDTPVTDAVLGLERTGSFVFAIGDEMGEDSLHHACIHLKAYGLPSPAVIESHAKAQMMGQFSNNRKPVSPLLWSIPLRFGDAEGKYLSASLPVELQLSSDGRVGVVNVASAQVNTTGLQEVTTLLVLLDQATSGERIDNQIFFLKRTEDRVYKSGKDRLWKADYLPCLGNIDQNGTNGTAVLLCESPGYVFLSSILDTIRITWFRESGWKKNDKWTVRLVPYPQSDNPIGREHRIVAPTAGVSLWSCSPDNHNGLEVVFEQELFTKNLMDVIVSRHPKMMKDGGNWTYCYDFISVQPCGYILELCLGFVNLDSGVFISVIVCFDLLAHTYREVKWAKHAFPSTYKGSTQSWVTKAWTTYILNWRMRQKRVGPYCINPDDARDWTCLIKPDMTEAEGLFDFDPDTWQSFLNHTSLSSDRSPAPNSVALLSLFPDSYNISNLALLAHTPVFSMKARAGPTQLVYMNEDDYGDNW
jgi:hypothetical protein